MGGGFGYEQSTIGHIRRGRHTAHRDVDCSTAQLSVLVSYNTRKGDAYMGGRCSYKADRRNTMNEEQETKYRINSYVDRQSIIQGFANSGYLVRVEEKTKCKTLGNHSVEYWVVIIRDKGGTP
jgi:hypothetical protein